MNNTVVLFSLIVIVLGGATMLRAFEPTNRPIDAEHYKISLTLDPRENPDFFDATVVMRLRMVSPVENFTLDSEDLEIQSVTNTKTKEAVAFETGKSSDLKLSFPKKLKKGEFLSLAINYRGKIRSAHTGLFRVSDPDDAERGPLYYTHFEALGARSFFPCNDEPYDKATTEIIVTTRATHQAVSNGELVNETKWKKNGTLWRKVHWRMKKPHSTYLVSLAIAPFEKVSTDYRGKEVSVWVGKKKARKADFVLHATKEMIGFFEGYLGVDYPWGKYATVGLPTFLWGGMENTSATHMNEERTVLNDPNSEYEKKRIIGLAAHELAHQWFGDLVTMKWWDDLWLNEAFASHLGTLATKAYFKNEEADLEVIVDTWDDYFRQEDGPRSHPIIDKKFVSPDDAFDSISYTKGENVLRMLSFLVGEDAFRASLKHYLGRYAHGNATYLNFFDSVEKASKQKLHDFRNSWLLQRGYPVLSYGGEWNPEKSTYHLTIAQASNHANDKSIFHFRLPITFHRKDAPEYHVPSSCLVSKDTTTSDIKLLAEPQWVTLNAGGVVLAKLKQQVLNESTLATQALHDPDPIARVWAGYELLRALFEDKPLSPTAETTLIDMISKDKSPYVRIAILDAFTKTKTDWLPEKLGEAVLALARKNDEKTLSIPDEKDPHGWRQFRSKCLLALGKVKRDEVLPFLARILAKSALGLDNLGEASLAVATQALPESVGLLKSALKIHENRGYRYRFLILYAFGAYRNSDATSEIREIAKTAGSDLMGRLGWVVRDNHVLRASSQWAKFLEDFVMNEKRFGDEVKTRILQTVEDVKNTHVKELMTVLSKSPSERIREIAMRTLKKNF